MIIEKVDDNETLAFYEIMRNPVLFGEFVMNYDKLPGEDQFEFTTYQKEFLLDFNSYISICCSRAVGKTLSLTSLMLWYIVYNVFPGEYINYHVPGKNHLEPVFSNLIKNLRTNSFLKQFISPNSGINQSDFKITLLNQATILCRIAGQTGTGYSVIGLHSPVVIFDESGYFPFATFLEGQPTLNTFTPGFKMYVSGVPDGRREKSVCYFADQESSAYSKHRVNSLQNPRFSETDHIKAKEQYGGTDSDDYKHFVLGEHGHQVFALFDRAVMDVQTYPVYQLVVNGMQLGDDLMEYYSRIRLIPNIDNDKRCIIGIDLGYTEPSAFIIMTLDRQKRLHFHARIRLEKVSYPIQEKLIDVIDDKFRPFIIGIDRGAGGQGISLIQHLLEHNDYAHKKYSEYISPIDFSTSTVVGIDGDGNEIKQKTKPLAVSILQDYTNNHRIVYSTTDLEMVTELERMTYTRNPSGDIVYRTITSRGGQKGEDHFTASMLVLVTAYYLKNEFIQSRPTQKRLAKPGWF